LASRLSPKALVNFCTLYSQWIDTVRLSLSRSVFLKLAKKPFTLIGIHFLIIMAIIIAAALVSARLPVPDFLPLSQDLFQQSVFLLSVLFSLPFLVDTMRNLNVLVWLFSDTALSRPAFQQFSKGIYRSAFNGLILLILLMFYGSVFLLVAAKYFPTGYAFVAFLMTTGIVGWIFWKKLVHLHHNWETAVVKSMASEAQDRISQKISTNLHALESREPWDVSVEPVILSPDSKWVGMEVREIDLRANTGALIAGIERNGFELVSIDPTTHLYPNDQIFLLGESDQLKQANDYLNQRSEDGPSKTEPFVFTREIIPPLCDWIGMRIQDTEIRTRFQVTIVGIQKGENRIIGPSPEQILDEGDLILLMGSSEKLEKFKRELSQKTDSEDVNSEFSED
jgi:CPA2 family monovalent cation:H+ antiporter-2